MDTTATLEPPRTVLDAGQEGTIALSLRNDSEIVEEYALEVVGELAEWSTVEPAHVSVFPGQNATAAITFRPPRTSAVPAGEHAYGVHVRPVKRPENATVPEGVVELLPFYGAVAELSPQSTRSKRSGRYRVAVDNRGNAPVAVALAGKSASDGMGLVLSESERTVEPGATWSAEIRAEPLKRLWWGTPVAYPFTIMVRPEEVPEVTLAGTQYHEPVLPTWTLKALLGLVVLAVLGVVASQWFADDGTGDDNRREVVAVPAVVGRSVSEAEAALREVELEAERLEVFHGEVPAGNVVSADPGVGEDVEKGSTVVLDVSKGPEGGNSTDGPSTPAVVVPDNLVGRLEAEVRTALQSAQLVVGSTSEANSASVPQGAVVETVPAGGTTVQAGSPVQLVVSTGMVTVPQLVGLSREEAITVLDAEDVALGHKIEPTSADGVPPGQVVDQSAAAGESVAQGSTITLTVALAPVPTVPESIELAAPPGPIDDPTAITTALWPEDPWAGAVDVTSIVLEKPKDYAGRFSIELWDAATGTKEMLHQGELSDLAESQELVRDRNAPEEQGSSGGEDGLPPGQEGPLVAGPIERFDLIEGRNLLLAMRCYPLGANGEPQTVHQCAITFHVDGEVIEPETTE